MGVEDGQIREPKHRLKQRFEVIRRLGHGTYGKVQLAINKDTGQEVAIKTIKKVKIENEQDLVRIRREIQIMSYVQHPHIIHIHEVFENKDKIVLVMQYASGGEMYDYLKSRKSLTETDTRRIFRQIVSAIYYCHKNRICHRDLKLENILLDERGNAKIADFGLSNIFSENNFLNTFCGSPLYASPEIVKGKPYYGPEVDCWSLGVLLYTMIYGAMPFDGSNFKGLVKQISEGDYYEPKKKSDASGLIQHLLTVNPAKRANITDVCNHWWANLGYEHSLLKVSEDLANFSPINMDALLNSSQHKTDKKIDNNSMEVNHSVLDSEKNEKCEPVMNYFKNEISKHGITSSNSVSCSDDSLLLNDFDSSKDNSSVPSPKDICHAAAVPKGSSIKTNVKQQKQFSEDSSSISTQSKLIKNKFCSIDRIAARNKVTVSSEKPCNNITVAKDTDNCSISTKLRNVDNKISLESKQNEIKMKDEIKQTSNNEISTKEITYEKISEKIVHKNESENKEQSVFTFNINSLKSNQNDKIDVSVTIPLQKKRNSTTEENASHIDVTVEECIKIGNNNQLETLNIQKEQSTEKENTSLDIDKSSEMKADIDIKDNSTINTNKDKTKDNEDNKKSLPKKGPGKLIIPKFFETPQTSKPANNVKKVAASSSVVSDAKKIFTVKTQEKRPLVIPSCKVSDARNKFEQKIEFNNTTLPRRTSKQSSTLKEELKDCSFFCSKTESKNKIEETISNDTAQLANEQTVNEKSDPLCLPVKEELKKTSSISENVKSSNKSTANTNEDTIKLEDRNIENSKQVPMVLGKENSKESFINEVSPNSVDSENCPNIQEQKSNNLSNGEIMKQTEVPEFHISTNVPSTISTVCTPAESVSSHYENQSECLHEEINTEILKTNEENHTLFHNENINSKLDVDTGKINTEQEIKCEVEQKKNEIKDDLTDNMTKKNNIDNKCISEETKQQHENEISLSCNVEKNSCHSSSESSENKQVKKLTASHTGKFSNDIEIKNELISENKKFHHTKRRHSDTHSYLKTEKYSTFGLRDISDLPESCYNDMLQFLNSRDINRNKYSTSSALSKHRHSRHILDKNHQMRLQHWLKYEQMNGHSTDKDSSDNDDDFDLHYDYNYLPLNNSNNYLAENLINKLENEPMSIQNSSHLRQAGGLINHCDYKTSEEASVSDYKYTNSLSNEETDGPIEFSSRDITFRRRRNCMAFKDFLYPGVPLHYLQNPQLKLSSYEIQDDMPNIIKSKPPPNAAELYGTLHRRPSCNLDRSTQQLNDIYSNRSVKSYLQNTKPNVMKSTIEKDLFGVGRMKRNYSRSLSVDIPQLPMYEIGSQKYISRDYSSVSSEHNIDNTHIQNNRNMKNDIYTKNMILNKYANYSDYCNKNSTILNNNVHEAIKEISKTNENIENSKTTNSQPTRKSLYSPCSQNDIERKMIERMDKISKSEHSLLQANNTQNQIQKRMESISDQNLNSYRENYKNANALPISTIHSDVDMHKTSFPSLLEALKLRGYRSLISQNLRDSKCEYNLNLKESDIASENSRSDDSTGIQKQDYKIPSQNLEQKTEKFQDKLLSESETENSNESPNFLPLTDTDMHDHLAFRDREIKQVLEPVSEVNESILSKSDLEQEESVSERIWRKSFYSRFNDNRLRKRKTYRDDDLQAQSLSGSNWSVLMEDNLKDDFITPRRSSLTSGNNCWSSLPRSGMRPGIKPRSCGEVTDLVPELKDSTISNNNFAKQKCSKSNQRSSSLEMVEDSSRENSKDSVPYDIYQTNHSSLDYNNLPYSTSTGYNRPYGTLRPLSTYDVCNNQKSLSHCREGHWGENNRYGKNFQSAPSRRRHSAFDNYLFLSESPSLSGSISSLLDNDNIESDFS